MKHSFEIWDQRMQNYNMEEKNEYIPKELKATKGKKYNATLI